eukprot:TRINITY_DN80344_c0_g1_i1.p1 TRINITY_DN80344_c0_g1~~TRINITY_DN80344_c0_g1_i1.p1  ORF type:complete len:233 (-),score=60.63 TRINITY_DN80344_c0_g1_i1:98-796(-)
MGSQPSRLLAAAALVGVLSADLQKEPPVEALQPFGQSHDPFTTFHDMPFKQQGVRSGTYRSQTYVSSQTMDADGQVHTERYASSAVGDLGAEAQEVNQAYANSRLNIERTGLERVFHDKGKKVVRERRMKDGHDAKAKEHVKVEEKTLFKGMVAEEAPDFEKTWQEHAVPTLPQQKTFFQRLTDAAGWLHPPTSPAHRLAQKEELASRDAAQQEDPLLRAGAAPTEHPMMQG